MTNAPSNASLEPVDRAASAEVTAVDVSARGPLLYLIGAAAVWLVISSVLALITAIQLHSPHFMGACEWFTHGRAVAMKEATFVYGWAANAGLGLAIWILGRIGGEPLRATNWLLVGGLFWNLSIALGLVGIATGDMSGFSLLQLPRYVQPLLLFSYMAMGVSGVLAWSDRRNDRMYASHWYAVAGLFLFPWLLSATQIVLFWAPLRGVLQAVAAGWYSQGAWTLWLAPLALAAAYYVVPKLTGKPLPSYDFASLGFWSLIFIGAWTGGRHLIGGPVPAWIATMAIVSCSLLLFHYFIVGLNLRGIVGASGSAAKFLSFGLIAYFAGGLLDAFTAFRGVAVRSQFTLLATAQEQLALYGAVTMIFFGAIYFMVPRVVGRAWASGLLVSGHRVLASLGLLLLFGSLLAGGWMQGAALLDAKIPFADVVTQLKPYLLAAVAAQVILLVANLLFAVNFLRTAWLSYCCESSGLNLFRQPAAREASAS